MKVYLAKLEAVPIKFDLSIAPNELDLESDFVSAKNDVRFSGNLVDNERWVTIDGKTLAEINIACGRCLEVVEKRLRISFKNAFVQVGNYTQELEAELDIKALEVSLFEGDEIDLIEVAEEQILLSLPALVYCKDSCKGLCQKCGANLNLVNCKCGEVEFDLRWSALSELKK